jgi:hypothetical protein
MNESPRSPFQTRPDDISNTGLLGRISIPWETSMNE